MQSLPGDNAGILLDLCCIGRNHPERDGIPKVCMQFLLMTSVKIKITNSAPGLCIPKPATKPVAEERALRILRASCSLLSPPLPQVSPLFLPMMPYSGAFHVFLQRHVSVVSSTPSTMGRGVENVSINLQRGVPLPAPCVFNEGTQWPSLAA